LLSAASYLTITKPKNTKQNRTTRILSTNTNAVLGLPMYLTVAVIVAAVIIAILALGSYNMLMESQAHQMDSELGIIVAEAENMFEYADEGTSVTIHVDFPLTLRYVVFGSLPWSGFQEPTSFGITEATSNNYYYILSDGTTKTFHSSARFSSSDITKYELLHAGSYDLNLELENSGGFTYVKINPQ
jgi:hypothetical protein